MTDQPGDRKWPPSDHPEEMRATWDVRLGQNVTLQGSGRCTPAGVVTAGVAAAAVLLAASVLVRAWRR